MWKEEGRVDICKLKIQFRVCDRAPSPFLDWDHKTTPRSTTPAAPVISVHPSHCQNTWWTLVLWFYIQEKMIKMIGDIHRRCTSNHYCSTHITNINVTETIITLTGFFLNEISFTASTNHRDWNSPQFSHNNYSVSVFHVFYISLFRGQCNGAFLRKSHKVYPSVVWSPHGVL